MLGRPVMSTNYLIYYLLHHSKRQNKEQDLDEAMKANKVEKITFSCFLEIMHLFC